MKENFMEEDSTAEKIWAMIMEKHKTEEDGQMPETNLSVSNKERKEERS